MNSDVFKNIHVLLFSAWRQRYMIILPILIMPIAGFIVGSLQEKVYNTHTTILVQEASKLNPFLQDLSVSMNLKERMAALDTLVHSRHVLLSVAMELDLIDETDDDWRISQVIDDLSESLTISLMGKDLVQIKLKDNSVEGIKEKLEVVSKYFIDQLIAPERSSVKSSENFLKEQLDKQRDDLIESEKRLAEFKRFHAHELPSLKGSSHSLLQTMRSQLEIKLTELAGAKAILKQMDIRLVNSNPVVGVLEERIVKLTGELTILSAKYTDKHSRIQDVKQKLLRLKQSKKEVLQKSSQLTPEDVDRLWNIALADIRLDDDKQPLLVSQLLEVQKAKSKTNALEEEVESMRGQINALQTRIVSFSQVEQELIELERDMITKQKLYDDFLNRYEMARITGALGKYEENSRIKIIDKPFTPAFSSNLPVVVFIVLGIVAGIGIGAGMAILIEVMDTSLRRVDQLALISGAPVIGRIPQVKEKNHYIAAETLEIS